MNRQSDDYFIGLLRPFGQMLNAMTAPRDSAAFFYDAMTEAVIWEDELPPVARRDPELINGLRPVFRYRASLILGEPHTEWQRVWQLAKEMFPNWVGFSHGRIDPGPGVRGFLRERVAETHASIDRMMANMRRRRTRKGGEGTG